MAAVLQTCLRFDAEIPEFEQHRVIHQGIFRAGEEKKLSAAKIVDAITRLEREYLCTPPRRLVLLTSLSIIPGAHLKDRVFDGARVRFLARVPSGFRREPADPLAKWPTDMHPEGSTVVTVKVKARSAYEAYERAMYTLDYLRGVWNFGINSRLMMRLFTSGAEPINRIRRGPYHTVHETRGALALQSYWYETARTERAPEDLRRDWPRVEREAVRVIGLLRRVPYARDLRAAFVRYSTALDTEDFESCFLKLWSVLELLTHTVGGRYDETIKRTLFLYHETDVNRLVLEHLRQHRNAVVHHGITRSEAETYTFQAKRYVETVLFFHLAWRGRFRSIAKFGEYLDLPADVSSLK